MADADSKWDVEADRRALEVYPLAWRLVTTLNLCVARVVGKYAAYPSVDPATFQRIHAALTRGLNRRKSAAELGDFCQELRSVAGCPMGELLRPKGADDTDARISAIAQAIRTHAELDDATYRELLTGLLSWSPSDKALILSALLGVIRGT